MLKETRFRDLSPPPSFVLSYLVIGGERGGGCGWKIKSRGKKRTHKVAKTKYSNVFNIVVSIPYNLTTIKHNNSHDFMSSVQLVFQNGSRKKLELFKLTITKSVHRNDKCPCLFLEYCINRGKMSKL